MIGTTLGHSKPGTLVLYRMPAAGGNPVPITRVNSWTPMVKITDFDDHIDILSIDWSRDENTLALSRGKTYRDVVLLKGFR